jgi:hypothetical protein
MDSWIGPQAFKHTHSTLGIFFFFLCEEKSYEKFNLLQIGPWAFGALTLVESGPKLFVICINLIVSQICIKYGKFFNIYEDID